MSEAPLIERMRETVRTQAPAAERAEQAPEGQRPPRVARKRAGRAERRARERREISRAGEVVKPAAREQGAKPREQGAQARPEQPEPQPVRPQAQPARAEPGEEREQADPRLATLLAALRADRGWSLQDLARRSGVSRSTLSRIERGDVSPTAAVLAKLAAAYERPLASLIAEVEPQPRSLVRAAEQTVTGPDAWRRRAVSPPFPGLRGSIVDATLLPGSDVTYDPPVAGTEHHLWLITGSLEVSVEGDESRLVASAPTPTGGEPGGDDLHAILHRHGIGGVEDVPDAAAAIDRGSTVLIRGDCLRLRLWGPARLRCLSPEPARYAVFTVSP